MTIEDKTSEQSSIVNRQFLSLAIVAGTTAICYRVLAVNATTAGFAYLVGILGIAAAWGLAQAVVASVAATPEGRSIVVLAKEGGD